MKRNFLLVLTLAFSIIFLTFATAQTNDSLPSWKVGAAKKAIIRFVRTVTDKSSPYYVPPDERIATFDNDGTLWSEQPMYFQLIFALDRVKALAPKHPEWKTQQPFKAVIEGDLKTVLSGGKHALIEAKQGPQHGGSAIC